MSANLPRPSVDENISTTLSSGITDVATSMDVADASKIVAPCYLVIDQHDSAGTLKAASLWEYVKVTNVASNTLTITRSQGGSTGQAHGSGAVVEAVVTSSMFEDWYAVLNPEHTPTGTHILSTATVTTQLSVGVGTTDATEYTPLILVGGGTTRVKSQITAGVSTSAVTILPSPLYLTFALVYGSDGTNKFSDVVLMSVGTGTLNVISSLSAEGSPAARTYTQTGSAFKLAMASGTYTVKVCAFTLGDS